MLMSFRILLFISLFSTFVSCVPKKESDFTKFKAPELQKANNLNTPEERPIELEIPPMESLPHCQNTALRHFFRSG